MSRFRRDRSTENDPEPEDQESVDLITGLPTRHHLHEHLEAAVRASKSSSTIAVMAFVEAGRMRDVNDSFGPDIGDALLRVVGERLAAIDVPGSTAVRYEGAVFGLVIPEVPNTTDAETVAGFLVDYLSEPLAVGSETVGAGPIVGLSLSTDNYDDLDEMIRDAYNAVVDARSAGQGAFVVHDESKRARYSTRIDDRRLQDAISDHEFELHYQPIIRLEDRRLVGVEALIRWRQPGATNVGLLFPHDFLPLLEKSGRIVQVGDWVLRHATEQVARWTAAHPQAERIFTICNIGPHELAERTFPTTVMQAVEHSGIEPWQLCLDLTEAALRFNEFRRDAVWAGLRLISREGIRLALDGFGIGVASLATLREMRIDLLRIDRSFVEGLGAAGEDPVIIRHVAALAHDLGCLAGVQGVETAEQAAALDGLDLDLAQGFHFGRPLPPPAVEALIDPDAPKAPDAWDASNVLPS